MLEIINLGQVHGQMRHGSQNNTNYTQRMPCQAVGSAKKHDCCIEHTLPRQADEKFAENRG